MPTPTYTYEKLANGLVNRTFTPEHVSKPELAVSPPFDVFKTNATNSDATPVLAFHITHGSRLDDLIYPATNTIILIVGGVTTTITAGSGTFQAAYDAVKASTVFQKANTGSSGSGSNQFTDQEATTLRQIIESFTT